MAKIFEGKKVGHFRNDPCIENFGRKVFFEAANIFILSGQLSEHNCKCGDK